jgi:hypothetical protein
MIVSEREAVFLRAADVLAAKAKEITDVLIEEEALRIANDTDYGFRLR